MIQATIRAGAVAAALTALAALAAANTAHAGDRAAFDALVSRHAAANGLPEALVHRVIVRESRYNPRAISKGNYGIMQIRLGTAHAMGYRGGVEGLLDADTNMTYAVKYLAGAYRAAGGDHSRAVALYARGYYYEAKRQGFNAYASEGPHGAQWSREADMTRPVNRDPRIPAPVPDQGGNASN